jgi:hypothetical protein
MLVEPSEKAGEVISPFCIQNHTGLEIVMKLDNSFEVSIIPSSVCVTLQQNNKYCHQLKQPLGLDQYICIILTSKELSNFITISSPV